MPIIRESGYSKRPLLYFNSYLETLVPYFTTRVNKVKYERERLELPDGDFIDLDWLRNHAETLVIISHGLEGNAKDHFIEKSAAFLAEQSCDVLVWHYRSCSREMNRLPRFYDHGDVADLHQVLLHGEAGNYKKMILLGYSMGGSIVVNYLGGPFPHPLVMGGVVFSAPLDLKAATKKLGKGFNKFLEKSFIEKWKRKIIRKSEDFPGLFYPNEIDDISSLEELYERFVLPLHGYTSMSEYYRRFSGGQFIPNVKVPLLIVNAKNDPMLSDGCYPYTACEESPNVYLETPRYGGHTGFTRKINGTMWYLKRIIDFIDRDILIRK